jgi:hypothetical protein
MCTFYLPASFSASGFQGGAGRQNPRFSQSCALPISCTLSLVRLSLSSLPLDARPLSRARVFAGGRGGRADGRKAGWARGALLAAHRTYVS